MVLQLYATIYTSSFYNRLKTSVKSKCASSHWNSQLQLHIQSHRYPQKHLRLYKIKKVILKYKIHIIIKILSIITIRHSSVIRQKYESYVCVSGGKKCSFFGKFGVLCFLETPVLRFVLLPYYRPYSTHLFPKVTIFTEH